jgi:hypothetical protein
LDANQCTVEDPISNPDAQIGFDPSQRRSAVFERPRTIPDVDGDRRAPAVIHNTAERAGTPSGPFRAPIGPPIRVAAARGATSALCTKRAEALPDYVQAVAWYRKGVEHGAGGQIDLGNICKYGCGGGRTTRKPTALCAGTGRSLDRPQALLGHVVRGGKAPPSHGARQDRSFPKDAANATVRGGSRSRDESELPLRADTRRPAAALYVRNPARSCRPA